MEQFQKETERRKKAYQRRLMKSRYAEFFASWISAQPPLLDGTGGVAFVLLPVLMEFVKWVLQMASQNGIRRLYFLSRDMKMGYEIGKSLCDCYQLPIKCRYLHGSRYSLRTPMYGVNLEAAVTQICRNGMQVTLWTVLCRAGFSAVECEKWCRRYPDLSPKQPLSPHDLSALRTRLLQDRAFLEALRAMSDARWDSLAAYLRQEGLLDDVRCGIVDSGWTGSTQQTLQAALMRAGCSHFLQGYYFGLYEVPKGVDRARYQSFCFQPNRQRLAKVLISNNLLEAILQAAEGSTVGYRRTPTGVAAVLSSYSLENEAFRAYVSQEAKAYLAAWTAYVKRTKTPLYEPEVFLQLRPMLYALSANPTRCEAECFGRLLFSDELLDAGRQELAPVLSRAERLEQHLSDQILGRFFRRTVRERAWYAGSLRRSAGGSAADQISHLAYRWIRYWYQDWRQR